MSKVGCTVLLNRENSSLSPHFGKAKWVIVMDTQTGKSEFEQNYGLNGRGVVDILLRHQCSDAVFAEIGPGALNHLQEAGIRAWFAPLGMTVPEIVTKLEQGSLNPALQPSPGHGGHHRGHEGESACGSGSRSRCCQKRPEGAVR